MNNNLFFLFSYGSNSINQIKKRLNINRNLPCIPSYFSNHIRIFAGYSKKWNGGVASYYKYKGSILEGICTLLTHNELLLMDTFEIGYKRKNVTVSILYDSKWINVTVQIYKKLDNTYITEPSKSYLNAITLMLKERNKIMNINKYIYVPIYYISK
jgi:hypothetical protein